MSGLNHRSTSMRLKFKAASAAGCFTFAGEQTWSGSVGLPHDGGTPSPARVTLAPQDGVKNDDRVVIEEWAIIVEPRNPSIMVIPTPINPIQFSVTVDGALEPAEPDEHSA